MNATAPLSPEVMNKIRRIEIRTRHKVEDLFAGSYLSVFKGRGIEFDEVRPYQAGDDVRTVDWNVTARMGELYVKRFIEERELTLLLMVDVSGSQDFGSVSVVQARSRGRNGRAAGHGGQSQQRQGGPAALQRSRRTIYSAAQRPQAHAATGARTIDL